MSEQLPPISVPVSEPAPASSKKGLAIASLILGILSLCASIGWFCGAPISIVGIILGFLGRKSSSKSLATIGILLSAAGLLLTVIFIILAPIFRATVLDQIYNQIYNNIGTGG
ncbi:MAG: DUF4190 domain-containing protein [Anaerolineales bacterium]